MTLQELIALLEGAEGPDRWLDAKIDAAVWFGGAKMQGQEGYEWAWKNFPTWAHHKQSRGMCGVQHDNGDLGLIWDSLEFTSSVDAAMALAIQLLDDGAIDIEVTHRSYAGGKVLGRAEICGPSAYGRARAKTPALALVLASLRALQAKTGDRTE